MKASKMKQGTLFSFFSKKPAKTATAATASAGAMKKAAGGVGGKQPCSQDSTTSSLGSFASQRTTASNSKSNSVSGNGKKKTTQKNGLSQASPSRSSTAGASDKHTKIPIGTRLEVYWPDDDQFYPGIVSKQRGGASQYFIHYDDETTEWIDLSVERYRLLKKGSTSAASATKRSGGQNSSANNTQASQSASKRRRIQDDDVGDDDNDDLEFQFTMSEDKDDQDDDDDGSVFAPNGDDDDDDDHNGDDWMVTDDEADLELSQGKKKKKKKRSGDNAADKKWKITHHDAPSTPQHNIASSKAATPTADDPAGASSASASNGKSALGQFANTVSPSSVNGSSSSSSSAVSANTPSVAASIAAARGVDAAERTAALPSQLATATSKPSARRQIGTSFGTAKSPSNPATATATPSKSKTNAPPPPRPKPTMYQKGAVNSKGSHVHNHLKFLQQPKDANGKSINDPGYNPRTLRIVPSELERHGVKLTSAVQQWWDLKAQYFDTVLLFKTGKFYEMFHMDADIGVDLLGFNYMKGHIAHAGFPEIGYGNFSNILVKAGYKVARVEQTETPDMLKKRKANTKRGQKKPQVVNREVCSIMTMGTRTFCYLDDTSGLTEMMNGVGDAGGGGGNGGPLLAIREIIKDADGGQKKTGNATNAIPNSHGENGADDANDNDDDDEVRPVCEYGITLIDSVRAEVTLGQFADDVLRSRMHTLLTTYTPSEILVQGHPSTSSQGSASTQSSNGSGKDSDANQSASATLHSVLKAHQNSCISPCRVEVINHDEFFPKSTALDSSIRKQLERGVRGKVHPWNVQDTVKELHRRGYYPRASRQHNTAPSVSRWPSVLKAAVEGSADLCISSFGAALYYLQRNLIDGEILSMGQVKAYIPPSVMAPRRDTDPLPMGQPSQLTQTQSQSQSQTVLERIMTQQNRAEAGDFDLNSVGDEGGQGHEANTMTQQQTTPAAAAASVAPSIMSGIPQIHTGTAATANNPESHINNMALDGTTLHNLEILTNAVDHKVQGSLWSKINHTKTPHGSRLLRAWLLRPLFQKADIDRRADAVEELKSGAASMPLDEAQQQVLSKIGDLERLLTRVHSLSGWQATSAAINSGNDNGSADAAIHPNDRAVLYEGDQYTKRKVGDFSKLLNGLRVACRIPELFADIDIQSGLLKKIVQLKTAGGCFPDMVEELDWFFENFDCDKAAKGTFEPTRGMDDEYDNACDEVARIQAQLDDYKDEMCNNVLQPSSKALSAWKYINVKPESKDKYLIELPASLQVPDDFIVKGKRGSGAKQVNKYRSSFVAELMQEYETVLDIQKKRKAKGMQLIFAKFDQQRSKWAAAAQATALLDALGSLAKVASRPGYCRATIVDCPANCDPSIKVVQGRHPCVENTASGSEFIPNDLALGSAEGEIDQSRVLLLSGPNMGGKSTLLRQTCLIAILAQIGCFVPAECCELTPVDCIYTRLGASDRILLGQSTFFVELAETAAALRGATRRSLVIMDELGRGTSTFDGTAIAGATVKHLVERSKCLALFATHYHSLLDEWKAEPEVRLGHMECLVEDADADADMDDDADMDADDGFALKEKSDAGGKTDQSITFLYTLGVGTCPKSFGINVARLASLPDEVLVTAKRASAEFEAEVGITSGNNKRRKLLVTQGGDAEKYKTDIMDLVRSGNLDQLKMIWQQLQQN